LETLEILLQFAAQVALDGDFLRTDCVNDRVQLLRRKILRACVRIDIRRLEHLFRVVGPDAVNVRKRGLDSFVTGNVYAEKSWHVS
jgi:hypothetical protein